MLRVPFGVVNFRGCTQDFSCFRERLIAIIMIWDIRKGFMITSVFTCLKKNLKLNDFDFAEDGTTEMKLSVLLELTQIHKNAKMVGDYNCSRSKLYTDKLSGTVKACLGFTCEENSRFFVPNTALKEDIRDLIVQSQQVIAIFSKNTKDELYSRLTYLANGIKGIENLILPQNIREKIRE